MVLDARVLILDEPTSSLDRDEVDRLFAVVRDLRDKGVAILFVSHFLDQVYEIADRITVLRNGQLVGEYRVAGPAARAAGDQDDRPRDRGAGGHLRERRAHDRPHRRPGPARDRDRSPRRPRARRTSTSTRARSSASPGCWAPAGPSSSGCSTAPTAPTQGRSRSTGSRSRCPHPGTRWRIGSRSPPRTAAPRASSPTSPSPRTSSSASRPGAAGCARSAAPSRTPSSRST